jgi:hypothetical protein
LPFFRFPYRYRLACVCAFCIFPFTVLFFVKIIICLS